jgi:hypothetical protein
VFLTVPKLQNASRLLYSVEASDTLAPGSWSALGLEIREDSSSRLIVRDQIDPALRHTRAFRVRVRWRP